MTALKTILAIVMLIAGYNSITVWQRYAGWPGAMAIVASFAFISGGIEILFLTYIAN